MIAFARESFDRLYPEMGPLIARQWREVGMTPLLGRLDLQPDIDLDLFRALDRNGRLRCLAARDGKTLVGYFIAALRTLPHYRYLTMAAADTYYLVPEHRAPRVALRLFEAAEAMLREAKPDLLMLHAKVELDHGRLFQRLGYAAHDKTYVKFAGP